MTGSNSFLQRLIQRWVNVNPDEIGAVVWSFIYFFSLLCGYYILRPMREAMGIAGGVENLDWMFTGTFIAMLSLVPLFGWAASRYERRRLLPYVYYFFISNILVFYVLFESNLAPAWVAIAFFIWVSVFNLFVVSVFWSFMTDIYTDLQSKRLFGFIAAGGTIGALVGPALTASLVVMLGTSTLLLISCGFLVISVYSIHRLGAIVEARTQASHLAIADRDSLGGSAPGVDQSRLPSHPVVGTQGPMGGGIFSGIKLILQSPYLLGICLVILMYTTLSTFLYFQQAEIIRDSFSGSDQRTAVFAGMDFAVNALTLLTQVFLTAALVKRLGMAWTLAVIPLGLAIGFLVLGFVPVLGVLIVFQVVRRAGNFAVMKPAREMLFVVLGKEEKYKAKNVIDTVVYRGGDAVSAWAYSGLQALGLSLAGIAFVAVPLSGLWAFVSYRLGKANEQKARKSDVRVGERYS